jgi:hypothetical protein
MQIAEQHGISYHETFKSEYRHVAKEIDAEVYRIEQKAIVSNKDIVVDRTHMTKKTRQHSLDITNYSFDEYKKVAVVFDFSDADLLKKVSRHRDKHSTHPKNIPDNVIDDMIQQYEEVTKDEGFDDVLGTSTTEALKVLVSETKRKKIKLKISISGDFTCSRCDVVEIGSKQKASKVFTDFPDSHLKYLAHNMMIPTPVLPNGWSENEAEWFCPQCTKTLSLISIP